MKICEALGIQQRELGWAWTKPRAKKEGWRQPASSRQPASWVSRPPYIWTLT